MAHNITDDKAMVYAGATPWHGLGTKLPRNGKWEEIVDAAGFYTATEAPLFANVNGSATLIPDRKAIVRADRAGAAGYLACSLETSTSPRARPSFRRSICARTSLG